MSTTIRLENGQTFPNLNFSVVGKPDLSLPNDLSERWAVVLFYRGHWCPYCRQQLTGFQQHLEAFDAINTSIVALSVDPLEESQKTVERHGLTFAVGYDANAAAIAASTGAYINPQPNFLQATGFVLKPDGTIATAVYSSGAVGRLVAEDTLGLVKYLQSHS